MISSSEPPNQEVTKALLDWSQGDKDALARLMPLIYDELHRLASRYMRRENPGHTLQATALINEAYIRLVDQTRVRWQNRAHFLAIAAQTMRRILIDHARSHQYAKRGSGASKISLDEAPALSAQQASDLVELNEALTRLAAIDPRKSRVVELRFFGGLTTEEAAEVLQTSPATVLRDWSMAKAWLYREMSRSNEP